MNEIKYVVTLYVVNFAYTESHGFFIDINIRLRN